MRCTCSDAIIVPCSGSVVACLEEAVRHARRVTEIRPELRCGWKALGDALLHAARTQYVQEEPHPERSYPLSSVLDLVPADCINFLGRNSVDAMEQRVIGGATTDTVANILRVAICQVELARAAQWAYQRMQQVASEGATTSAGKVESVGQSKSASASSHHDVAAALLAQQELLLDLAHALPEDRRAPLLLDATVCQEESLNESRRALEADPTDAGAWALYAHAVIQVC